METIASRVALLLSILAWGCGGPSPSGQSPQARDPHGAAPQVDDPPTADEPRASAVDAPAQSDRILQVGDLTDGATLEQVLITTLTDGTLVRFVFDAAGPPPVTRAHLASDDRIVVEIHGVRGHRAELPLVTGEADRVLASPRPIAEGPVADIGRYFLGDDSAIRIELTLRETRRVRPVRIELDVAPEGRAVDLRVQALP